MLEQRMLAAEAWRGVGVVVNICDQNTWETEAGGLWI